MDIDINKIRTACPSDAASFPLLKHKNTKCKQIKKMYYSIQQIETEVVFTEDIFNELTSYSDVIQLVRYSQVIASTRNRNRKLLISRAPTKAKSQEPAYSQALNENKIDRQRSRSRESGRQTVRRLWWMVFGVETGR